MKKEHYTNRRNYYFDFLKGLAIMMVVGIHTYPGNDSLKGSFSDILQLFLINFFNCAVPLFLALSGYFIGKRSLDTFDECKAFWKRQIPKVYVPCLIFSLPWFIISLFSGGNSFMRVALKLVNYFLCGYSVYYFIALIIECYLLAPFLVRHQNKQTLVFIILFSVLSVLGIEYVRFFCGYNLPLIIRGAFPGVLIFFYLGIFLSNRSRQYSLVWPIIMMIIGLLLGFIQMEYLRNVFGISGTGQKITLYLFDIGFILLCLSKKCEIRYTNNIISRMVLFIGEISFGIYFTHVYLIFLLQRYIPALCGNWLVLWFISVSVTILFIVLMKLLFPSFSNRYLGYR